MVDVIGILIAFAIGLVLGAFYFGGLWLTLRRLPGSRSPHTYALLSFFGRTAVVVLVVFLVARQSWQRVAGCLAGFLIMRGVMVFKLKPRKSDREQRRDEARRGEAKGRDA